jgi:Glutaredoxin 2, C terminal domain
MCILVKSHHIFLYCVLSASHRFLLNIHPYNFVRPILRHAGGLSYDDIDLFSRLRSVTIVKGVKWPTKLAAYMQYFSVKGDVPLYDSMAC